MDILLMMMVLFVRMVLCLTNAKRIPPRTYPPVSPFEKGEGINDFTIASLLRHSRVTFKS